MPAPPPRWQTLLCFAIIYFVWGSTFLAIRIGVAEVPPFLLAALRFLLAGLALLTGTFLRREPRPTLREIASSSLLAFLIFVCDYGLLFWAEQRVPSGIAAVMLATIPVFIALSEILILRTQRLTLRLASALVIGLAGVAALVSRSLQLSGAAIDLSGAAALLFASVCFSVSAILTSKLPLPAAKTTSAGTQMFLGGIMLTLTAMAFGELSRFHPSAVSARAWFSLAYLAIAGSVIGFTAYLWLLQHHSPTKVGTYAYVNPLVAVLVGYAFGGEPLTARTIAGSLLILVSVVLITTSRRASRSLSK